MHHRLCHANAQPRNGKHMNFRSFGRHAATFAIACFETCTTPLSSVASPWRPRASWHRLRLVRRADSQNYRSLDNRLCPCASSRTGIRTLSLSFPLSCPSLGRRQSARAFPVALSPSGCCCYHRVRDLLLRMMTRVPSLMRTDAYAAKSPAQSVPCSRFSLLPTILSLSRLMRFAMSDVHRTNIYCSRTASSIVQWRRCLVCYTCCAPICCFACLAEHDVRVLGTVLCLYSCLLVVWLTAISVLHALGMLCCMIACRYPLIVRQGVLLPEAICSVMYAGCCRIALHRFAGWLLIVCFWRQRHVYVVLTLCFGVSACCLTLCQRTTRGSRCRFRGLRRVSCISSRRRPCRLVGRAMCRPCL